MNKEQVSKEAIEWVKKNKKKLVTMFACPSIFPPQEKPVSVFMAGSPGAGKTEFAKNFIKSFEEKDQKKVIHIDADEIRKILPGYNGKNSYLFQAACSIGIERIHDIALKNKQSFIFDGTFSNFKKSKENIERSLARGRKISIFYLYQNPLIAWKFTQKREKEEGRSIPKEIFIKQFFSAKENVEKVKEIFGNQVQVDFVEKDFYSNLKKVKMNIERIDSYVSVKYSEKDLKNKLL